MNVNLDNLEHNWTAEVELNNGQTMSIWWTAWPMSKHMIKRVISVASDFPKREIKESETYKFSRGICHC